PCDEPFYGPSWIRAHARAFEKPPFTFAVARAEGKLRALLPLKLERKLFAGTPTRLLRGMSSVHSCRFGLIHGKGDGEEAARAIWAALRDRGGFDLPRLAAVPEGTAAEHLVAAAASEGHRTEKELSFRTPYLPLPVSLEELLAATDGKFRSNLRRR